MKKAVAGLAVLVLTSIGCGGGTPADMPDIAPVSGIVTLDGNPLPNAKVTFQPVGEGRPSSGVTDSSGSYTLLYTVDASGAILGEHRVSLSLIEEDGESSGYGGEGEEDESGAETGLPSTASDGSIRKTVEAGVNELNIELASD